MAAGAVADQVVGGGRVRGKGITYDTGFFHPGAVTSTRDVFDPEVVRPEDELLDLLAVCAEGAERLRRQGAEVPARINDVLTRAVEVVGAWFGGRVSYASLPLEGVDWAAVDVISSDAGYRG
jgi:hypothetical protein